MIWFKNWTAPIWRVDSKKGEAGQTLRNIYALDRPTYFLTNTRAAQGYIDNYARKNTSGKGRLYFYIKKFVPKPDLIMPVRLLDLGKADTIRALLDVSEFEDAAAIKTSFQIQANNSVKRVSEGNTKHIDDIALAAICRYCRGQMCDGYYINAPGLHAEIGLCPESFNKFMFADQIERIQAPPVGRKRTRNNRGNGNGNGNRNRANKTIKRMKLNNNANAEMGPPTIRRFII